MIPIILHLVPDHGRSQRAKNIQEIKALLPSSKKYLEKTIDIPLSPLLDQSDLDYLIDIVEKTVSDSEYSNHYSSLTSLKVS